MVQICGMSPSYKRAPTENESWGLPWSPLNHRYDIWFEMHDRSLWETRGDEYVETLRNAEVPIYMQKKWEDIPNSVEYPLTSVISAIGADYFNSSIAYMLGLAIFSELDIEVWGVDNHTDEEWFFERPCNEYLLGVAIGRGLQVWVHPDSSLLKFMPEIRYNDVVINYQRRYGWLEKTP